MTTTVAISDDLHHQLKLIKAKEGFRIVEELTHHLLRDHQRHAIQDELSYEEIRTLRKARSIMKEREKLLKLLE
ncbi:MAG: hypothetical protein ACE5QF_09360 [Thermoplasmata archaeon]